MDHRRLIVAAVTCGLMSLAACGRSEEAPGVANPAPTTDVHILGWPWVDEEAVTQRLAEPGSAGGRAIYR